jgi:hypothetical protein
MVRRFRYGDNIKIDFKEMGCEGLNWNEKKTGQNSVACSYSHDNGNAGRFLNS